MEKYQNANYQQLYLEPLVPHLRPLGRCCSFPRTLNIDFLFKRLSSRRKPMWMIFITEETQREGLSQLINILEVASFEVRKFGSNKPTILSDVPTEHVDDNSVHKLEGLSWNSVEDVLSLGSVQFADKEKLTKRKILKDIAQILIQRDGVNQ